MKNSSRGGPDLVDENRESAVITMYTTKYTFEKRRALMRQLISDMIEMLRETMIRFRTCENSAKAIWSSYVKEDAICRPIGTMDTSRIIG